VVEGGLELLKSEARSFKRSAFAASTQKTYRSQLKKFLQFCLEYKCSPIPVSQSTLICYVAYLARNLSASSIPQYLNVVRILHEEAGLGNPLANNFELSMVKRGVRREKGVPPNQKLPITVGILRKIYALLDLSSPFDLAFWAAALTAFFGFLRKSTLLPESATFVVSKTLLREDVNDLCLSSFVLSIRHSKVIQFGQKVLSLPYVRCSEFALCPVLSLLAHFGASPLSSGRPLFSYAVGGREVVLVQRVFVSKLRALLVKVGVDPLIYSAHSFRRGGASYAFQLGLSPLQIKLRGDWASDAYERYVYISSGATMEVARALAGGVTGQ
jgi:hypothetical protein